ncbi:MAG: hypothetical protein HC930_00295 [Hydrococcus sp. SU_1_0]|nr:hypothetical protein [Hydrococcus sp. SU_1_0]
MPDLFFIISEPSPNNEQLIKVIGEQINWLSTVVGAIFLSIIGNLATNPIQNYLAGFSTIRGEKRIRKIESEIIRLDKYVAKPLSLISYSIQSLVFVLLFFGIAEAINALQDPFYSFISYVKYSSTVSTNIVMMGGGDSFMYWMPNCLTAYCYVKAVLIAQDILITFKRVENLPKYKHDQQLIIQKLNENQQS